MIITCLKCSTSFNLDDSLVKKEGSTVRCSVCKHVFKAYPAPLEQESEPEASSGLSLESDPDNGDIFKDDSDFEMEDSDFSLEESDLARHDSGPEFDSSDISMHSADLDMDDTDLEPEGSGLEGEDTLSFDESEFEMDEDGESQALELDESNFDFEGNDITYEDSHEEDFDGIEFEPLEEEPAALDMEESETRLEMEGETDFSDMDSRIEDNSLQDESMEQENEFELEFDVEDGSENDLPDILDHETDEIPLEIEAEPDKVDSVLSLEENGLDEPLLITPEDDFSEYDAVLEQETEPEEDTLEEDTLEEETMVIEEAREEETSPVEKLEPAMDITPRLRRRKKKSSVGAPVLILLLILLLVVGAYIASIMTGYKIPYLSDIKIPFIEQYLKKPAPEVSDAKPVPNQKSVNGRFVTNATAGTLFVITGRVENPSDISYSHIEVRGALITKDKMEAKTKNAFCGNIVTEEMLKTGNISDINALLTIKEGTQGTNVDIKPGASIPFMVVFSDLPEKLQNFTVKVNGFEKTNNKQ